MADPDMIFSGIQTTQNVIDSWIRNGLNLANYGLSKRQMQLQEKAFDWQKYYDQNQTQIRVDDMAKAGLNPVLAAGSAGASAVSGVSASPATPVAGHGQDFQSLIDSIMQNKQLKQQKTIADDANETAKDIAETKAESEEKVAELNAQTSAQNAALNAQTQTAIAAANNEALKGVRGAQERHFNGLADKEDWQNAYNALYGRYDGNPKSIISYLDSSAMQVAGWLGVGIDKAREFIKWAKDKIKDSQKGK